MLMLAWPEKFFKNSEKNCIRTLVLSDFWVAQEEAQWCPMVAKSNKSCIHMVAEQQVQQTLLTLGQVVWDLSTK